MNWIRTIALGAMGGGLLLMALVVLMASGGSAAYAGVFHGTPDPNATPDITADDHSHDHDLTYYADIEPIFVANCAGCHMPDGIGYASWALDDVAATTDQRTAEYLAFVTGIEYMPPWPPSDESVEFLHERTLTDDEIAMIAAWAESGAPRGDIDDRPALTVETNVPTVREDVVLTMDEPYTPDASLDDDYRCFLLDTSSFEGDQYLTGFSVEPGADTIVHHVIVYQLDGSTREAAVEMDAATPGPGWQCYGGPGLPMRGGGASIQDAFDPSAIMSALEQQGIDAMSLLSEMQAAGVIGSGNVAGVFEYMSDYGVDLSQLMADMDIDYNRLQAETLGLSGLLAGWVPGAVPTLALPNTGRFVPQDTVLVMQVHYNLSAGIEPDQTSLVMQLEPYSEDIVPVSGSTFVAPVEIPCPEGVEGEACSRDEALSRVNMPASDALLLLCGQDLETYADNTADNAYGYCDYTLPYDGWMVEVGSHMHELGQQTRVTINPETPDALTVIDIPDWDFHWQGVYTIAQPIPLEAGDVLRLECWWDNSDGDRYVVWGEGTADEMCFNNMSFIWNPIGALSIEDFTSPAPTMDHMTDDHSHADGSVHDHDTPYELSETVPAPTVDLVVVPDAMSGYNIQIATTNFAFAPQAVNLDPIDGEGHAHIYVDGEKVARVYGEWYHLDGLPSGEHTITVTLNANNHQPLAVNGAMLSDSVTISVP